MKILVITEQRQGKWNNTSFETLAAAQQIATALSGTVSALMIGKGVDTLAVELAGKNVAEVLQVEHGCHILAQPLIAFDRLSSAEQPQPGMRREEHA